MWIHTILLQDTIDRTALRAAPYMPDRLRQLVWPQPDQQETAGLQHSRPPQLTSSKAVVAVICLMLLSAMLLVGYGFHCVTTASPTLTRTLACVIIMVSARLGVSCCACVRSSRMAGLRSLCHVAELHGRSISLQLALWGKAHNLPVASLL